MRKIAMAVVAGFLLSACSAATPQSEPTLTEQLPSQPTPSSEENSLAGTVPAPEFPVGLDWLNIEQPLTLAQLQGKLVLLDFWTYGCVNCMHVIPDLQQLEEEYPEELVVIGVHSAKFDNEGITENIRQVILRYGIEHPVVNDHDFDVWNTWGASAWPSAVLIDPAGNAVLGHRGEGYYQVFKPLIESLVLEFDQSGLIDRTPLPLKLEKEGRAPTVLSFPGKLLVDEARGRIFISDTGNHRIVVVETATGRVLDVMGGPDPGFSDGNFVQAAFHDPQGLALSTDGTLLFVADSSNHAIREIDLEAGTIETLVGTGRQAQVYPPQGGIAPKVDLSTPWDLELGDGQLFIAMAGSHQIWSLDLENGSIDALVGSGREGTADGPLQTSELAQPSGLTLDRLGRLFFADSEGSSIRWAELEEGGEVWTAVGTGNSLFDFGDQDGFGPEVRLQHPLGVVAYENRIYVADTYNSKIKRLDPETRVIETLFGGGQGWRDGDNPLFYEPGGLDAADGKLYVADTNNHAIRIINLVDGKTSTLVVSGIEAFMPVSDFEGKVVELAGVVASPGTGRLVLDLILPAGYKVNDTALSSIVWTSEGSAVENAQNADWSIAGPQFPLESELSLAEGTGRLTGDLTLYYCEAEKEALCLIERVRLAVPLMVNDTGQGIINVQYEILLPEGFSS
jgi:DNA-binding beta-propeller fold protein YncE